MGKYVMTSRCILFETKIVSGSLRQEQIEGHLGTLARRAEPLKRLVLLTPDDSSSQYIQKFRRLDADRIFHLGWKRVYGFFEDFAEHHPPGIFTSLIRDFLDLIHKKVFEQDFVGVILKIDFGKKSSVHEDRYLNEFATGTWTGWNTPQKYKNLDGTGRKLLLYDRTRGGITAEVEIEKLALTDEEVDYPWANVFAPRHDSNVSPDNSTRSYSQNQADLRGSAFTEKIVVPSETSRTTSIGN